MSIGDVFQEFRKEKGLTQEEFAEQTFLDRSSVAKIENGKRPAPKDFMLRTATTFDEPRLYLAAQEEVTDGACVPWLDNADLHRAATHYKSMEEAEEALAAMKTAPIMKRPDQLTAADREAIKITIFECVEAITALTHHVAVLCKEYTFSWLGIWKEHRAELKAKKYMN
ncbi:transcriptional regulator with XRE-family HTH domain [Paenibacillus sp. DS2015]|uniref:helix-turn-helix domain-containing protein n=1 Tax=Paenibacillus sp. DS2015 TaxID=3373917 RepID=UPI003D214D87